MKTWHMVLVGAGAALVLTASAVSGPLLRDTRYGRLVPLLTSQDAEYSDTVTVGDRFTFVVRDNNSLGDNWWLKRKPDWATAALVHDEYVSDTEADTFGNGQHYYTFLAKSAGQSQIVLVNMIGGSYTVTVQLIVK